MAQNNIKVRSTFDDTTTAGVTRMNRTMQKQFKNTETASKGVASGLRTVAKAAGGLFVFSKIIGLGKAAVKNFDEQAKAEVQLANALGRTSKGLLAQASALQKVTLFGDEATIRAQALIGAFVKEEEQIKAVIPLVQDLAQAKGMDLSAAADMVSKTLGSSTNALARYGIQVEGGVGSTERLDSLTRSLQSAFGGSAEAAAKAGAGGLTQFSNAMGDISEQIGALLLPMLIDLTAVAGEGANVFTGFVGVLAGGIGVVKGVMAAFMTLGEVILASMQGLVALVGLIPDRLLPKGWGEGIDDAIAGIDLLRETFKIASEDLAADAVKNFGIAGKAFSGTAQTASEIAQKLGLGAPTPTGIGAPTGGAPEADEGTEDAAKEKAVAAIENESAMLQAIADIRSEFRQLEMDERQIETDNLETWYTEQAELIGENNEAQLELFEVFKAREAEIEDKFREQTKAKNSKELKDFKDIQLLRLSIAADVFGSMSDLLKAAGKEQKEFAALSKALAIVQTTIDTYVGAQKAFNSFADISIVGYGLGVAAAAATIISGLARVAVISSQGFQFGGVVPGTQFSGDQVQVRANSGEGIFTTDQQQTLFDIASGRIQAGRGAGIENLNLNIYGNTTEETTEDMIEKLDNLLDERELSGIAA